MGDIHFIHTADLHLDSPFQGLQHFPKELFQLVQESTFIAFERVIDIAIARNVDFLVIVGDLFDGEDRSIKAQARLRRQMERLEKADIAVFITHGNHDHLDGNWLQLDMPNNVHTFGPEVEMIPFTTKSGTKVHLYGFSYPKRHVYEKKITTYAKIGEADFHIGLLHGQYDVSDQQHQPYAPFSINELLQKQMDYWALGHIHTRRILHQDPFIVYSGNIQGRNPKEQGEKGCYVVTLTKAGTASLDFTPTSVICWESVVISCQEQMTLTELMTTCIQQLKQQEKIDQGVLLELVLQDPFHLDSAVIQKIETGEFLEILQDEIELDQSFTWPYKISFSGELGSPENTLDPAIIHVMDTVTNELFNKGALDEVLSSLYSHVYAGRYLDPLTDREKQELIKKAQKLMKEQLRG